MNSKSILIIVVIMALVGLTSVALTNCSPKNPSSLEKVNSFQDLHGLAVKPDGDLFIATHHGLFLLKNDRDLYRVGNVDYDLMGFSMNPQNPEHVYASGHPASGGNLGVIVSQDGGLTWRQVFRSINGEAVDFHAMAIGLAEPKIIYGWYQNKLYRTEDGGNTWNFTGAKGLSEPLTLATSYQNPNIMYAGTGNGLNISRDKGETWSILAPIGLVGGIAADYENEKVIYAFTQKYGMAKSADDGTTWQSINNGLTLGSREAILYVTIHPGDSKILYVGTTENGIFKSDNRGQSWVRIK